MTSMKCHKCEQRAVIRMRQHRLALCKDHYIAWFIEQTLRFIDKYHMFSPQERVLVAVSGGKDSLALWDVLWQTGYSTEGMYINLGISGEDDYSNRSEQLARQFADERNLVLHVVNVRESYGASVPGLAFSTSRGRQKPCAVCGLVKRHIMNQAAADLGFAVLATAHNLDDEVSFLFGNTLSWDLRQLGRQSPVLPEGNGFPRKVKPFIRFAERETAAYSLVRGIHYIEEECPHAEGSKQYLYKDMLNQLEESQPGTKLRFLIGYLNAKDAGAIQAAGTDSAALDLHPCPQCGQLTSSGGLCSFCRLVERREKRE